MTAPTDDHDEEWGTTENREAVDAMLRGMYELLCGIIDGMDDAKLIYILDLAKQERPTTINVTLTEKQWRILRFAVEYARQKL